jgi:hypothetical protein
MIKMSKLLLTQIVKHFVKNSRWQKLQFYKDQSNNTLIKLEAHPSPRKIYFYIDEVSQEISLIEKLPVDLIQQLRPQSHPACLYARAHYLGESLNGVEIGENATVSFNFTNHKSIEVGCYKTKLNFVFKANERKDFKAQLQLTPLTLLPDIENEKTSDSSPIAKVSVEDKRYQKLLNNVESDINEAQKFLSRYSIILSKLQQDPTTWNSALSWNAEEQKLLQELFDSKKLPAWGAHNRKTALEKSYSLMKRQTRKISQAQTRLAQLIKENGRVTHQKNSNISKNEKSIDSAANPDQPKKKPGLWVCLRNSVWIRIGKSAQENAELYRQARDRDLWFHVREQKGAHVWVPSGQKAWNPKKIPDWLIEEAAQVAFLNSKARANAGAVVDYTERRNLKSIKGKIGELSIMRSDTIYVRKNVSFEKELFGLK